MILVLPPTHPPPVGPFSTSMKITPPPQAKFVYGTPKAITCWKMVLAPKFLVHHDFGPPPYPPTTRWALFHKYENYPSPTSQICIRNAKGHNLLENGPSAKIFGPP